MGVCPKRWLKVPHTETCIKLYHDRKPWEQAREQCKADGGDLVKIVDFKMNQLILCKLLKFKIILVPNRAPMYDNGVEYSGTTGSDNR